MALLKFDPKYNALNSEENALLEKAVKSVKDYVKISAKASKTTYATRDAHAKAYAIFNGKMQLEDNLPEAVTDIFKDKNYEIVLRLSNASPVVKSDQKDSPLYGFSLKIKNVNGAEANFPMVNFPLLPLDSPSSFLKFFTALNVFLTTKTDNFVVSAMDLPMLLKNSSKMLGGLSSFDVLKNLRKTLKQKKNFILSYDYHAIGAYRIGNYIMKLRAVPETFLPRYAHGFGQTMRIENFLENHKLRYALQIQLCHEDELSDPVNDLKSEWKNSPYIPFAMIECTKSEMMLPNEILENLNFNPWLNEAELQPVGKIQQIRKDIYAASIETRNELNLLSPKLLTV